MALSVAAAATVWLYDVLYEERLAQNVIDLVASRVIQILALQNDARSPGVLGETRYLGDDRGPAGVRRMQVSEFLGESGVELGQLVGLCEFVKCGDK